ncbi:MAG TPA: hypothetical protein DF383_09075 [Deltaproteobacteria bacterium]|nr:hypothetical protein [Deltaproteobacteria bacterium]
MSKNKKLMLGSALAGLVLAGPGLSVTANSSSASKFFQTAELHVGYRLANAAGEKKADVAVPPSTTTDTKAKDGRCSAEKKAEGKCAADGKCSADMKGKEGKCSADKKSHECSGEKCGSDKKSDAKGTDGKCGAGSCG